MAGAAKEERGARRRRDGSAIRELIFASAREQFQKSGYSGATTAAIARGAGVTETQIFRLFRSKADLFREAVFEPLDDAFAIFNRAQLNTLHPKTDELRPETAAYIAGLTAFIERHRTMLVPLLAAQLFDKDGVQGVGGVAGLDAYFEVGARQLSANSGIPIEKSNFKVRASFAAVLSVVLLKEWLFPPAVISETDFSAALADFVVGGFEHQD